MKINQSSLVSIIIPVFNPPIHMLNNFYKSLEEQTLENIEIIFINDNSNIETVKELQKFSDEDGRVLVLNNEKNLKAGLSRQRGLSICKGEYVLFADCDDYLIKDACEVLFAEAKKHNADIVYSSYEAVRPGGNVKYVHSFKERQYDLRHKKDAYYAFLSNNNALWNKLFRKDLVKDIDFPVFDVNIGEDKIFNIKAFVRAKKIIQTEYISYKYTQHEESVTGSTSKGVKYLKVIKESEKAITKIIDKSSFWFLNRIVLERRYCSIYFYGMDCIRQEKDYESKQKMSEYWKLFVDYEVLPKTNCLNQTLIKLVFKYKDRKHIYSLTRYIIAIMTKLSALFKISKHKFFNEKK